MTDPAKLTKSELAALIDHTILKPEASRAQVHQVADEGRQYGVASVCVNPLWVPTVVERLDGSGVKTCSVVGFPLGSTPAEGIGQEARRAIDEGAAEIDMVAPLGLVKSGDWDEVRAFIDTVRAATEGTLLKVILETGALEDPETVRLCQISEAAGADYVKTSTGFHPTGGATAHAVQLMHKTVSEGIGVKASGGVRDLAAARKMIALGATRLGLSGTAAILAELD